MLVPVYVATFYFNGLYSSQRFAERKFLIQKSFLCVCEGTAVIIVALFALKQHEMSRLLIFVFAGLNAAGLEYWALYPVLLLYFFPAGSVLKALFGRRGGARAGALRNN